MAVYSTTLLLYTYTYYTHLTRHAVRDSGLGFRKGCGEVTTANNLRDSGQGRWSGGQGTLCRKSQASQAQTLGNRSAARPCGACDSIFEDGGDDRDAPTSDRPGSSQRVTTFEAS